MSKPKLNGSVELLGEAMKRVFTEAAEGAVTPIRKDIAELKGDIAGVKKDIAGVRGEVAEVRGEVAYARRQGGEIGS